MGQFIGSVGANIGGILGASAQYKIDKANVNAARLVQGANNELEAAKSSLSRVLQSIGNNRKLVAGGEQAATIWTNLSRTLDGMTKGTIAAQANSSREMGAFVAQAAAAGQGGGTIAQLKRTFAGEQARQEQERKQAKQIAIKDGQSAAGTVMEQAVQSLDNTQFFANMDYTQYVDPAKPMSPLMAGIMAFSGGGIMSLEAINQGQNMTRAAQQGNILAGAVNYGKAIGGSIGQMAEFGFNIAKGG